MASAPPAPVPGLTGMVALVTGAASGIGRATALAFAAQGAKVVGIDVNAKELAATAEMSDGSAFAMRAVTADVREPAQVENAVAQTVDAFGSLDIACNIAGVQGPYLPLADYEEDDFMAVLAVDLIGVWRCMKYELRQMAAQRSGSIVNVSSMLAETGMDGNCAYVAAKHGVHGLTRTAALESAEFGIRINAVAPGITRTAMTDAATGTLLDAVPLQRIAEPAEIADAILWLASPASSYVTGTALVVDGGYLAR